MTHCCRGEDHRCTDELVPFARLSSGEQVEGDGHDDAGKEAEQTWCVEASDRELAFGSYQAPND